MEKPTLSTNEKGVSHARHRASAKTGTYRGRQVIDMDAVLAKKAERRKRKEKAMGVESTDKADENK